MHCLLGFKLPNNKMNINNFMVNFYILGTLLLIAVILIIMFVKQEK